MGIFPIVGFIFVIVFKRRTKKNIKNGSNERTECLKLLEKNDSRDEIERIYQEKKRWSQFVTNQDVYEDYLNKINQIQYKKNWTLQDLDMAKKVICKLKECFMESSGDL